MYHYHEITLFKINKTKRSLLLPIVVASCCSCWLGSSFLAGAGVPAQSSEWSWSCCSSWHDFFCCSLLLPAPSSEGVFIAWWGASATYSSSPEWPPAGHPSRHEDIRSSSPPHPRHPRAHSKPGHTRSNISLIISNGVPSSFLIWWRSTPFWCFPQNPNTSEARGIRLRISRPF